MVIDHSIYLWLNRIMNHPKATFWMNGAAGVDIFFVISGFVMTISLPGLYKYSDRVKVFLQRRLTRIVPLYWLATTFKLLLVVLIPGLAVSQRVTWQNVLGSYLFLPVRDAQSNIVPLIVVGWTLNFEMFFYLVFSLAILFRRQFLAILCSILVGLAILSIFSRPSWPPITVFVSPMLLEFLFGVVIARLAMTQRLPGRNLSWLSFGIGFLAILALFPYLPYEPVYTKWRFLLWGLPAAAIILGAVGLEKSFGAKLPAWLISLGDASYAIYLVQTFVLPPVAMVLIRLGLGDGHALAASIIAGVALSALAGEVVHYFVEKPILLHLKGKQLGAGISA